MGCDLGTPGAYLPKIEAATADIDVALVFNNAGYIVTGFFDKQCAAPRPPPSPCVPAPMAQRPHGVSAPKARRPLAKHMANEGCG